jgi:isopenicillin N synthase-like dioxygenase
VINKLWLGLGAFVIVAIGVVAFVSLGHGVSGTPGQRLEGWATSMNLGQDVGTLEGDGASVRKAISAGKGIGAVHTVCAAMASDAQTYNDNLPSPDSTVTQLLARAYGLEYDAAESCYRATSTRARLLKVSSRDRTEAATLFGEALRRIRSVTGHTVPTTTTTVPDLTGTSLF